MFQNIFDSNNRFWQAVSRLADLMILNICFIITSIPLITIGTSLASLYYVTLKMAENEEGYIFKSYLKAFRQNFRQATLIWLIFIAGGSLLMIDYFITKNSTGLLAYMKYAILAMAFIFLLVALYIFPLIARFENTIPATIKNALIFAVAYLPRTVIMLIIVIVPWILTFYNGTTFGYMLLFWILIGFALVAYANSHVLKKLFAIYTVTNETDETGETVETVDTDAVIDNTDTVDMMETEN